MLFNSFAFLAVFLPVVVVGYWAIVRYRRPNWSILWLLAASYVFYCIGEHRYFWLIAVSILVNFLVGQRIAVAEGRARKLFLVAGLAFNLVALGYFKYGNFLAEQLALVAPAAWPTSTIDLPIGISFYTFTQIAFLADVFQRRAREQSAAPYALFVTYFPHLIAGPILHHAEMLPQFRAPARGDAATTYFPGTAMLIIGLAKKVLLADPCGGVATGIFATPAGHGWFVAWIGAVAYSLQIYFDFSGYSDMAIGASRLLGIDLPINFNSPYRAISITDFWRRWHITLSRFLRDYLYIPLGGNRRGRGRRYVNLFVTMLLGGLWHGAGWTFIVWGALHGAAQTITNLWGEARRRLGLRPMPAAVGWLLTMGFVVFAWVPFRARSMSDAMSMWRAMAGLHGFAIPALGPLARAVGRLGAEAVWFSTTDLATLGVAAVVAVAASNSQHLLRRFAVGLDSPGYDATRPRGRLVIALSWPSVIALGILLGASLRAIGGYSEFIYFHF